jgi:hypothetical protein
VPETRVWKGTTADSLKSLKVGDHVKYNVTSEFPGRPAHCTDVWIIENLDGRAKR